MDSSGSDNATNNTNTAVPVSPFAPVDATSEDTMTMSTPAAQPDNAVKQPSDASKPADAVAGVTMADIPEPQLQAEQTTTKDTNAANNVQTALATDTKTTATPEVEVVAAVPTPAQNNETPLSTDVTIEALLEECINHNASDLHIQVGLPPTLRIDGVLRPITTYPVLDQDKIQELIFATLDEDQQKIFLKDKEFDYSFAFGDLGRFRVNAFHERGNMAAAFRLIPNNLKSLDDLGLPGVVETFAEHPHGLVLVTGPTGSGKSTTLAALIDKINSEKPVHIITIEDPIEFTHHSKRALVVQREVHYDTFSFAAALRSILREDPDVVLIGEMRDLETIQAAITVAETGHLVFATLHTNSAAQSIDRMIDVFPAHQQSQIRAQLASVLVGICSQRLIPAIDGGRVCVAEIMVVNPAIRAIIREGKTHQLDMAIQTGADQGMQSMDRELAKFVKSGIISYDIAHEYAVNAAEFERLARG